MITLKAFQGMQFNEVVGALNPDGSTPTSFEVSDTLAASVWEGQNQATIFSPTVSWFQGLASVTLTGGGTLYTAPTVTFTGGGATTQASAYATIVNGSITAITITDWGDGYTGNPAVVIADATGSGASATAIATLGWQTALVAIEIAGSQTTGLDPDGTYHLQVSVTRGSLTAAIIDCLLKIVATPGSTSSYPPDLVTLDYAITALELEGRVSSRYVDILPYLINAASEAARLETRGRNFDLRTYTEFQDVNHDGTIRLLQPPVQQVLRVQGNPGLALTVQNGSAQFAQVLFSYTGQFDGYGANAQVTTGLIFNQTTNGVAASQSILWTALANPMIVTLATAINGLGNGWSALADSTLGLWPVTELDGGYVGQGCAASATPSSGAIFNVLQDLAPGEWSMDPRRMGFLAVGQQLAGNIDAMRWGPGGFQMFGNSGGGSNAQVQMGRVKVTYVAGQTTIPPDVQNLVARLAKWKLSLMKEDLLVTDETAADYSFRLATEMIASMPRDIREGLAKWRLPRA